MPKAYSYIRMSTEIQLKGDSARRQLALTSQFVAERGLELADVMVDPGKSAFRGRNIEFGAKLAMFREQIDLGRIEKGSYLIVESIDRLSRQNVPKAFDLLRDIVSRGVVVVTLDDRQEYRPESFESIGNLFIALGSMMRAHDESKRKSERVSAAWQQKKKDAASKGKFLTRRIPAWLSYNETTGKIEVDEERATIVRQIFELVRDGWGAYSIARALNERRMPAWSSRRRAVWRESYIKKMVHGRTVLGEYQPNKVAHDEAGKPIRIPDGAAITDYYPPVVSETLYHEAQQAMSSRRTTGKGRKGRTYPNVFTGLLRCGACGGGITFLDKGPPPKGGRYLRCSISHAKAHGKCMAPAWRYEWMEQCLLSAMEGLDVGYILEGKTREHAIGELNVELGRAEREVEFVRSAIDHTATAIRDSPGPPPGTLVAMLRDDEARLARAEAAKSVLLDKLVALRTFDPEQQQRRLKELLSAMKDDEAEHSTSLRRTLSAEIRRSLEKILIKPCSRIAWELLDEKPLWLGQTIMTNEELQDYLDQFNFEIVLVYRNGREQHLDPLSEEYFELQRSKAFDVMRAMHRAKSM